MLRQRKRKQRSKKQQKQLRTQRLLLIRIIVRQVTRIPEAIVHLTAILEAIPEIIMVTM